MLLEIILTWLLFLPIAIFNGVIRETTYKKVVGDPAAHQISTLLAAVAFLSMVYLLRGKDFVDLDFLNLFLIGSGWMVMTVLFEFGFGHFIDKLSWEKLLSDYNILKGRVWSLFLITELITPLLVKFIYRR